MDALKIARRVAWACGHFLDPDRKAACVACIADALLTRERERDQQWADYVDWLNDAMTGHYAVSMVHGFTDSLKLIEEGKRRRAALGYVPKSERDRIALTPRPRGRAGRERKKP